MMYVTHAILFEFRMWFTGLLVAPSEVGPSGNEDCDADAEL